MPLSAKAKLGPYEIISPIGAGGMGEVYKAKDSRLDRIVAVKVLPSHLSDHDELRQRFEQEARAVSSLNHPNICTLHDIGRADGIDFIVMEYVEGETLADRLMRGAIPWQEAVRYAVELADALDKAHRAGVVHRDVKPGNVIVTKSGIKLLDFGLAKLHAGGASTTDLSAVTEAKPLTEKGAILGTFQYMAPEQLEGKQADARSDIFALGAVLYEMATGAKAFTGESQASLIAAIMSASPRAMSESGVVSPPSLERVVNTCLAKDPDRRWQSAADLELNLEWLAAGDDRVGHAPAGPSRARFFTGLLGWLLAIAAATIAVLSFSSADRSPVQHFQIALGENEGVEPGVRAHVALSPDGSQLAFVAVRDGINRLYLRRFDEQEAHVVAGTEHAFHPFFSPDGEWVAFQTYPTDAKLKKVSIHGGAPQLVHDNSLPAGATWLPDDTIVFGDWPERQGLFRVSASGGAAEPLLLRTPSQKEGIVLFPQALPAGQTMLFTEVTSEGPAVALFSFETGTARTIVDNASQARYIPTGHLIFVRGGDLWAARFDLERGGTVGTERPIISGIEHRGWSSFDATDTGVLAYVPGERAPWIAESLAWMSRDATTSLATDERMDYEWPRISPSGSTVALFTSDDAIVEYEKDLWLLDVESRRLERITFHPGTDRDPVWTPDGRSLIFASGRGGGSLDLYRQSVDSRGEAVLLRASENDLRPEDVSPDGRVLAYREAGDIFFLSLDDGSISPFLETPTDERFSSFSPDGRFLAYVSEESGQPEVYVQPYPPTGGKTQVSRGGGNAPVWARDGSELYYLRINTMVAVRVRLSPSFVVLEERELFEAPINRGRSFDVHPDGQFLIVDKTLESPPQYVNVVTSFFELLDR